MATNKKSFTAYCDWGNILDKMTDEQAGKLMKHLFDYVRDKDPDTDDALIDIIFTPIKDTLKRDLKKWESRVEASKKNGKKGGRPPKKDDNLENPVGYLGNLDKPRKPDTDTDTDTEILPNGNTVPKKVDDESEVKRKKENFLNLVRSHADEIGNGGSQTWIDGIYKVCKLENKALADVVQLFNNHLMIKTNGNWEESFEEYRKHCGNWIIQQYQYGKLDKYTTTRKVGSI